MAKLTIEMPAALLARIKTAARAECRCMSGMARVLLMEALQRRAAQNDTSSRESQREPVMSGAPDPDDCT